MDIYGLFVTFMLAVIGSHAAGMLNNNDTFK